VSVTVDEVPVSLYEKGVEAGLAREDAMHDLRVWRKVKPVVRGHPPGRSVSRFEPGLMPTRRAPVPFVLDH
jgi:hypothetical protein